MLFDEKNIQFVLYCLPYYCRNRKFGSNMSLCLVSKIFRDLIFSVSGKIW
jgi:hypothetical protein